MLKKKKFIHIVINGNELNYNNINFDPCETYNKYKYKKNLFLYLLSIILAIADKLIDFLVNIFPKIGIKIK